MNEPVVIQSRDNAQLKELRRLAHANTDYRKQGRIWVEGDHLVRAAIVARSASVAGCLFSINLAFSA
jgi:TrmH family RNA methyltransferase